MAAAPGGGREVRRGQEGEDAGEEDRSPGPGGMRRPVARSKGAGPGIPPGIPGRVGRGSLGSAPREWPRGTSFGRGVQELAFASSSWPFPSFRGLHLPSALAWLPWGPGRQKSASLLPTKDSLPPEDRALGPARRPPALASSLFIGSPGVPPLRPSVRTVVSPRRAQRRRPCADHDPGVQVDGTGGCFSAQSGGRCSLERARPPSPPPFLPFPGRFQDSLGSSRSHCHPLNCCLCCGFGLSALLLKPI